MVDRNFGLELDDLLLIMIYLFGFVIDIGIGG
jgi:hypothetical protein